MFKDAVVAFVKDNVAFYGLRVILCLVIFVLSKYASKALFKYIRKFDKVAEKKGLKHLDMSDSAILLLEKVGGYAIYGLAILVCLYVLGLKDVLFAFLASAGIAGLAIGFASKDIVANIMSGVLIMFDRPFDIKDMIEVGKIRGKVKEITIRSTKIEGLDGRIISVPNSKLATDYIINYSRSSRRMIELNVDVDFDSDIKKAMKVINKVISRIDWKSKSRPPRISIIDVTSKAVKVNIQVWTRNKDLTEKRTELITELTRKFVQRKIEYKLPK